MVSQVVNLPGIAPAERKLSLSLNFKGNYIRRVAYTAGLVKSGLGFTFPYPLFAFAPM